MRTCRGQGRFEDGLFHYHQTPTGDGLQVETDLIGRMNFVAAGPAEFIAERYPVTFRLRVPRDGSRDAFELDRGEVRSYARRVRD